MERAERWLLGLVAVAATACVLLTAAGVALLTVGADEAWSTLSVLRVVGASAPTGEFAPTVTSGGLFLALHALVGALAGESILLHRSATLACWLLALVLVWRIATRGIGSRTAGVLALAFVLSTPGSLALGAASHAEAPAFLVLLASWLLWDATEERRGLRWVGCGALLGLAAATRTPALFWMPALGLAALLDGSGRWRHTVDAIAASVFGVAGFAALSALYVAISPVAWGSEAKLLSVTGISGLWTDYPRLLNKWLILGELLPPMWVALVAAGVVWVRRSAPPLRPDPTALVALAALVGAVWVLRSPIPHVRYLWPALPCLWLAAGLVAARIHARAQGATWVRVACLGVALAAVGWQAGLHVRALVHGNLNQLAWESSREMEIASFRRFQAIADQRAAAAYLRATVGQGAVATLLTPFALRWASGVEVESLSRRIVASPDGGPAHWSEGPLPRRIVLGPVIGSYRHLRPEAFAWFSESCELERQLGAYAFYRVTGAYPEDAEILRPTSEAAPHLPLARPPREHRAHPGSDPFRYRFSR